MPGNAFSIKAHAHGPTHKNPRTYRPEQPGAVQPARRTQCQHQPYCRPHGDFAGQPVLPLPQQAGDHRRAVLRVRSPGRQLPAPAPGPQRDRGGQALLPAGTAGRHVALSLPAPRPGTPARQRRRTGRPLPAFLPALPDPRHGDLRRFRRSRHPADGQGADRVPDPQCLDHPYLLGAFFVYHPGKLRAPERRSHQARRVPGAGAGGWICHRTLPGRRSTRYTTSFTCPWRKPWKKCSRIWIKSSFNYWSPSCPSRN